MTELIVVVENIKDDKAIYNIKLAMLAMPGVMATNVSQKFEEVTVMGYEMDRDSIVTRLNEIGFPEKLMAYY